MQKTVVVVVVVVAVVINQLYVKSCGFVWSSFLTSFYFKYLTVKTVGSGNNPSLGHQ